jgi:anion-transporting  ArsA/GET3 family ATPase
MEAGFRDRALAVEALLASPETGFVLITSPRRDAMEEAQFFADKLGTNGQAIDALVVNRVHPKFGDESPAGLRAAAAELEHRTGDEAAQRLAARYENLADFREIAELERGHVEGIQNRVGAHAIAYVPYLSRDVYDFAALHEIGTILFTTADGSSDSAAV